MAINLSTTYANVTPPDANYTYGSAKNETAPGALDGTPIEKAGLDDIYGLMQSLLVSAGIVPNGNPDTVQVPQYLQAILNSRWYDKVDFAVGTKIVGSDGKTYVCQTANGPSTTVQDPATESTPRSVWFTEAAVIFDVLHPIGAIWLSNTITSPATIYGVGTWTRVQGRFLVGVDEVDTDYDAPGEVGGTKTHTHADTLAVANHTLTVAEMPAHTHSIPSRGNSGGADGYVEDADNSGAVRDTNTGSQGSNSGHNHNLTGSVATAETLPPYYATYIWRRTA